MTPQQVGLTLFFGGIIAFLFQYHILGVVCIILAVFVAAVDEMSI